VLKLIRGATSFFKKFSRRSGGAGARGSLLVKAFGYKQEGRGFETR
jgi:hypothetical protein